MFDFLDFLVAFLRLDVTFVPILLGCLVFLVVAFVLLFSCSLSVRHYLKFKKQRVSPVMKTTSHRTAGLEKTAQMLTEC